MPTMKRTRRAAAALLATSAGLVAALTTTAPTHADTPTYPVLSAVNTVTTSTSGVATVELKQPATLSFGRGCFGPARSGIYGKGRITALVLEHNSRALARYFRLSDCGSPGCSGDFSFPFDIITARTLTPGLYHLYVATDGAPVTAVLTLGGLTGSTNVPVSPSSNVKVETLAPLIPSTGVEDPGFYSASGSETIGNYGGVMLNTLDVTVNSVLGGYEGLCLERGVAPPVYLGSCSMPPQRTDIANPFLVCDPTAYCDQGDTIDEATKPRPFPVFDVSGEDIRPGAGDTWGQGNYLEGAMLFGGESSAGLWISFIPQESTAQVASSSSASATPPASTPTPTPTATPAAPAPVNLPNTGSDDGAMAGGVLAIAVVALGTLAVRRRDRHRVN